MSGLSIFRSQVHLERYRLRSELDLVYESNMRTSFWNLCEARKHQDWKNTETDNFFSLSAVRKKLYEGGVDHGLVM